LKVSEEITIVKLINRYITHKSTFEPLPEEDPFLETSHLTEEEKKHREEAKTKKTEEEKKKSEEEKKAKDDEFAKLSDLDKI
jgi:hypothetical protein